MIILSDCAYQLWIQIECRGRDLINVREVRFTWGCVVCRWWRGYVPKDVSEDLSHSDTRLSVQLNGFEMHIYNRSHLYQVTYSTVVGWNHWMFVSMPSISGFFYDLNFPLLRLKNNYSPFNVSLSFHCFSFLYCFQVFSPAAPSAALAAPERPYLATVGTPVAAARVAAHWRSSPLVVVVVGAGSAPTL
jgi:hypothetical protein